MFSDPLEHVINLSLEKGFFPNEMKIAKIIPLHKSGDAMNITNYHPISVLPFLSKIFEHVMYTRLMNFIGKHDTLLTKS